MELKEIYKPIDKDLKKVELRLKDILASNDRFITKISKYTLKASGKMLRPALLLLSSKLGKGKMEKAIDLAASIELIHTATLIHDDIIDNARLRRKKPSFNVKYGRDAAILFGDYLFSKSFKILSALRIPKVTEILLKATNSICRGEMQQLNSAFRPLSESEYIKIVTRKTASLFSACCEIGGVLSGMRKKKVGALERYGQNLGISFQIIDDYLDRNSDDKKTGKSAGLDAKGGKITLPVICSNAYSLSIARKYGEKAVKELDVFDEDRVKKSFVGLVRYVTGRVN